MMRPVVVPSSSALVAVSPTVYCPLGRGGFDEDDFSVQTDQTTVVASNTRRRVTVRNFHLPRDAGKLESPQNGLVASIASFLTIRSFYFVHSLSHPVISKHGRSEQQQSRLAVP
jgi:hypothetical protein